MVRCGKTTQASGNTHSRVRRPALWTHSIAVGDGLPIASRSLPTPLLAAHNCLGHAGEHGEYGFMSITVRCRVAAVALSIVCTSAVADSSDLRLDNIIVTATRSQEKIEDVIGSVTVITREE